MRIRIITGFLAALLPLSGALAAVPPAAIAYQKFSLPNGLEVILHEDHRLPLVAVNLWYHVGPANETAGRTGFAHLFEHLMFEGSKHIGSKAHFRYLESAGASDINGTTDFDRTNYFETLPSNQLELALWLESDRMGYLLDGIDAEKLTNQRDVVRNERRESYENRPYGLVGEAVWHTLFPASHPYHADIIGSHADVEAARLADVREFSRQYYTPNNASLAIAGDIDPAAARRLVERYFGTIPAGPPVFRPPPPPAPRIAHERRVVVTDQIELPRVYMAWITPPVYHPGDADADMTAEILGGGRSSRLYKRLVQQQQIAQDVSAYNESMGLASVFMIVATAKPGVTLARLEHAIDAEVERFRRGGPSAAELTRARNSTETGMLRQLQRLGGMGGVADQLNRYNQFVGDPGFLPKDLARYDATTIRSVRRLAATRLGRSARVVVEGVPGKKVISDPARQPESAASVAAASGRMPDEPWRANAPAAGSSPAIRLPTPTRFELPNGLTVILAEEHELPIVGATVVALAGTSSNPLGRPGLASFTASMLHEGTGRRTGAQVADDAAQAGADVAISSGRDAALVSVTVLRHNVDPALDLLADVVRHPRLDPKDVERVRRLREGRLQQEQHEPVEVSRRLMLGALYGRSQPLGYPDTGTRESNAQISAGDLRAFWSERYLPGSVALVLAGDLTRPEAQQLAERYFGDWRSSAKAPPPPSTASFEPGTKVLMVDEPGAPQSTIRLALPGLPRSTPDYVPLELLNSIFGGLASSRLNMNLREAHGYTYGAGSAFRYGRAPGYFNGVAQVRADVTAPALQEMLKELARIRSEPPTAEELALAQGAFAQSLAALFETTEEASSTLAELYVYDLPSDYYTTLGSTIYAVTTGELKDAAERHLRPDALKVIVVGDGAKSEPVLRELGLGPLERIERGGAARN